MSIKRFDNFAITTETLQANLPPAEPAVDKGKLGTAGAFSTEPLSVRGDLGNPVVADPLQTIPPEVTSAKSGPGYFSTLFRRFGLTAESTYNFYVEGETVAPTADQSGSLSRLPRYVTLRWRTAPTVPTRSVSKKGIRPYITGEIVQPPKAAAFDIAKAALANGYISPGVITAVIADPPVAATAAPTKIDEDSFLLSTETAGQMATDHLGDAKSYFAIKPALLTQEATVINFIDPSIAGTFDANRIAIATDPLHLAVLGSLAKVISPLEVVSEFNQDVPIQNPAPDFVAHPEAPSVAYVGYVIERYDLRPDGSMRLGRTISIDDANVNEFVDQRVAYNGSYVYRMRSIVQWTHPSDMDFQGSSTIDRLSSFASLMAPPLASFYGGDWSDWSRTQVLDTVPPEPPDELTVRPVSWKGEVRISWKEPNNPQDDLFKLTLVRADVVSGKVSDWKVLGEFVVANGSYTDRDVRTYESGHSYIYAMYSWSYHGVISPLSDQVEARLSPPDSREEIPVIQISDDGADAMAHASSKREGGLTEIKANGSLTFYCRGGESRQPLRDSTYLVEARSLSTGERALVTLDVDATDIGVVDA